jgi:hypothetical protein
VKLPWQQKDGKNHSSETNASSATAQMDQWSAEDWERYLVEEIVTESETYIGQVLEVRRQHPVDLADLLSDSNVSNPKQMISNMIKQGVAATEDLRKQTESLLKGDNLKDKAAALFRPNTNVAEEIKRQNVALHKRMRTLIEDVARRIESREYQSVETRIAGASMAARERESAIKLVDAHKQSSISVKALRLTVHIFQQFNRAIVERLNAGKAEDPSRERELVLANAVLVYEISNFVIRYMEGFRVWGIDEIKNLQKDVNRRFDEQANVERKLRDDAEKQSDQATWLRTLEQIESREKHAQRVRNEWDAFVNELDGLQSITERLDQRLATLKVIRDNARNQITFVDLLTMTSTVKDAIECLDAAVIDVDGLELVPITEERVERLLSLTA